MGKVGGSGHILKSLQNQDHMKFVGRTGAVVSQGVPGSRPDLGTFCCGLQQVTFTHCLVLLKPRKP